MKRTNFINIIFNGVFLLIIVFFISDSFTHIEIKSEKFKIFVHYGIIFLTAPILIWNYIVSRPKFIFLSFPIIALVLIFAKGPSHILSSTAVWKTREIKYENINFGLMKVEQQILDNGALGVNYRIVQATNIFGLFSIANKVPDDIDSKAEWRKTSLYVNE